MTNQDLHGIKIAREVAKMTGPGSVKTYDQQTVYVDMQAVTGVRHYFKVINSKGLTAKTRASFKNVLNAAFLNPTEFRAFCILLSHREEE